MAIDWQRKIGPLPMWSYAAVGTGAVGYWLWRRHQANVAAAAGVSPTAGTTGTASSPSDLVPPGTPAYDFYPQNQSTGTTATTTDSGPMYSLANRQYRDANGNVYPVTAGGLILAPGLSYIRNSNTGGISQINPITGALASVSNTTLWAELQAIGPVSVTGYAGPKLKTAPNPVVITRKPSTASHAGLPKGTQPAAKPLTRKAA